MTDQEIVQALRCMATRDERRDCEIAKRSQLGCAECVSSYIRDAAAAIERLTAENAAMRADLRENGCTYCKHARECTDDMHVFGQEDCDRCTKKPDCICMKCEGYRSSTDHWEWRGLPEAQEEGDT